MSDPFERLRSGAAVSPPPVDAIKSRARRIQRRRYLMVASSASIVVVLAGVGLFVRTNHHPVQQTNSLASETRTSPSPQSESAQTAAGTAGGMNQSQKAAQPLAQNSDSAAMSLSPSLNATVIATRHGTGEDFTLKVCNPGGSSTSRDFSSTERFDFGVSRGSSVVWRWSSGRTFQPTNGTEHWTSEQCLTWPITWNGRDNSGKPLPAGTYSVVGFLTSTTPLQSSPQTFCLVVC